MFPLCVLEFFVPSVSFRVFVPSVSFRVFCSIGFKAFARYDPHALKGQKLLAQGNALGNSDTNKSPCKGKSFIFSALLLQGVFSSLFNLFFIVV